MHANKQLFIVKIGPYNKVIPKHNIDDDDRNVS